MQQLMSLMIDHGSILTSAMTLQGMRAALPSPAACDPCTLNKEACRKSDKHSMVRMWAAFIATKRLWCSDVSNHDTKLMAWNELD